MWGPCCSRNLQTGAVVKAQEAVIYFPGQASRHNVKATSRCLRRWLQCSNLDCTLRTQLHMLRDATNKGICFEAYKPAADFVGQATRPSMRATSRCLHGWLQCSSLVLHLLTQGQQTWASFLKLISLLLNFARRPSMQGHADAYLACRHSTMSVHGRLSP